MKELSSSLKKKLSKRVLINLKNKKNQERTQRF